MKRSILIVAAAIAAASAIGAGGAASALTRPQAHHWSTTSVGRPNTHLVTTHGRMEKSQLSARARRALQASGDKSFVCSPAVGTPVNTASEQTCAVGGNNGTCIEQTDSPVVVQTCTIVQTGATDNQATVVQVAATDKGPSPQNHTQIVNVDQTSTGGSNASDVSQGVKQSLGPGHFDDTDEDEPDSASPSGPLPITTQQDFHQIVTVTQNAGTGDNSSKISQFGKQRARAKQSPSITEMQNTQFAAGAQVCPLSDDPNANICSSVDQTSGTGQNISTLDDTLSQFERAHQTGAGGQQQGINAGSGGINHEVRQRSDGFCKIVTNQSEHQVMRAVQANVAQAQYGPTRKGAGSSQDCNTSSVWTGTQNSTQLATTRPTEADMGSLVFGDPAFQTNLLEYFGTSTGDIRATQSVTEKTNGASVTQQNSCPASPSSDPNHACAITIACGNTDLAVASAPPVEGGVCTPSSDQCPPGTFFNSETGTCDVSNFAASLKR